MATPGGRAPTVDQASLAEGAGDPQILEKVKASLDQLATVLKSPVDLASVDHSEYDLIFYPGGHGPLEDLAVDLAFGAILSERVSAGTPYDVLCDDAGNVIPGPGGPEVGVLLGNGQTCAGNGCTRPR